jgi:predicted nucleotidyltransferase
MSMTLEKALQVLRANKEMLRARGVLLAAVFGSVARGEARPDSDVDVLIEVDSARRIGLFGYAGLCEDIRDLFPSQVDVVNAKTIRPRLRDPILSEAIYAF